MTLQKALMVVAIVAAGLYLAFLGALYFLQGSLIYPGRLLGSAAAPLLERCDALAARRRDRPQAARTVTV